MHAGSDQLTPYAAVVVGAFSVGFFCLVSYFSSMLTGWHKLAKRFRAQSEPYGDVKTAGPFPYTVYTRYWSHYSSMIRISAADDALYLSVFILLRVGHPPLRIPWTEITIARTRRFWQSFVVLTFGAQEQIPMRISERMARKLGILERLPEAQALAAS